MRDLLVMLVTGMLCLLSPLRPQVGILGYYWFALMRPDILAWSGPNRYSLLIALSTLLANGTKVLQNLPTLVSNSIVRTFLLLLAFITLSVVFAVRPELCYDQYGLFLRVALMAFLIPLAVRIRRDIETLLVVMAASIGLLAAKYGAVGLMSGGARFMQGFGGMLSDNNTMALAFVVALPLCWFSRPIVPWVLARMGLALAALLCVPAVIFTHSRGGSLALAVALLLTAWKSQRRLIAMIMLAGMLVGAAYLVKDTYSARMSTLGDVEGEASAKSRLVLAVSALKMFRDYPLFGVGFTEQNERALIANYLPAGSNADYAGKVIHNTFLQMLVDCGIFALITYCWLLFGTIWKMRKAGKRARARGGRRASAIPDALVVALCSYTVGSLFLSRAAFDFFYILTMTAAAYLEVETAESAEVQAPAAAYGAPEVVVPASGPGQEGAGRMRMTRERKLRDGGG